MIHRYKGEEDSHRVPSLFSFITLREERFGGIVFNPYLPVEVELDNVETLVAFMCDGRHTLEEIGKALQEKVGTTFVSPLRVLRTAINKLDNACALQYLEQPRETNQPLIFSSAGDKPPASPAWFSAPKSVIWDVTYACNLRCPHCLTDSGSKHDKELNTDEAFELIDRLSATKVLYLSLSGGEPFLRGDILTLIERIAHRNMRVDIATNGFDLPDQIIEGLRELPVFQVQVSIDGIGPTHDEFRGKADGFKRACNTLRKLKEEGIATSISTTATGRNISQLPRLIDLAVSLGCDSFKAIPFIPAGRGRRNSEDLWLGREGSLEMSRTLSAMSQELQGKLQISTETAFAFLLDAPEGTENRNGSMICSAGYDELSIGADGTAYPCPFLHDFPLGNVRTDSMAKIWHESETLTRLRRLEKMDMSGPCATCHHAPSNCRGGCRAAAYLTSGRLDGSDPLCFKDVI